MRDGYRLRVPDLLLDTPFRRYWTGRTLSQFGDQIRGIALPLTAVSVLHAGSVAMGLLGAAGSLPFLLFSLHAGDWVDRRGRRRETMLAADAARAALLVALAAAWWLRILTLPDLFALSFLLGTLSVLFTVSSSTLFVSLVPRDRYVDASSLLTQGRAGAFLLGPGIGGALVQALSAPLALLADALSFVASALTLARIRPDEPPRAPGQPGHLLLGLRFVMASPLLRASWLATGTIALCKAAFSALYILYMTRSLHVTAAGLGIILGPSSVGAIAASMLTPSATRRFGLGRVLLLGALLYTLPMVVVPLAHGGRTAVVLLLFAIEGLIAGGLMALDIANATVQAAAIPDALRARVMAAFGFTSRGLVPVGALGGGLLAAAVGVRGTLLFAALGASLGTLWLLRSPMARLRDTAELVPSPETGTDAAAGA